MELSQDMQVDTSQNSANQKFLLLKEKGLGRLTYKEIETQLEVTDEAILALQVTKFCYKEKSRDTYMISKREFQQIQIKTTWDKIDIIYAVFLRCLPILHSGGFWPEHYSAFGERTED